MCRLVGVRAAAFKALIEKFKGRCFLRTTMEKNPQWLSRAFVVPKPGRKYPLVMDYRHLNPHIEDLHFTLPNSDSTCSFGSGTSHSAFTRFNPVELRRGAVEPLNRG